MKSVAQHHQNHFFGTWDKSKSNLKEYHLMIFLDYDGTLTPIVDDPSKAFLPPLTKQLITALARMPGVEIVVISGRALSEIKRLVGISGLTYVGNHGFEIEGPSMRHVHPSSEQTAKLLFRIAKQLNKAFKIYPGISVENKKLTLSIHYRNLEDKTVNEAKKLFEKILEPYVTTKQAEVIEGKKVWEIRPALAWNKGATVLWLFERSVAALNFVILPIYIGDDQTDETAFHSLKRNGLTIRVTDNPFEETHAKYFLRGPEEVVEFLKRIKGLKVETTGANPN